VDGESRFDVTVHGWGRGVGNCPLVPLHTIAADPSQIPQGAIVRIDETVGMLLPDGTRHDGLWRAEDVGSAIQHDRVDIFVGRKKYAKYLTMAGIDHMEALTVTLVEHPTSDSCIFKRPKQAP
jgi:3D (Asp-Asp-Asp) domain-containing protein